MSETRGPKDPIQDVLASIADGTPVDWDALAGEAPESQRLGILEEIARIAAFSRTLQHGGEPFAWPHSGGSTDSERWGHLLLLERLSTGGRMEVYRAWDTRLYREVALKLTPAGGTPDAGAWDGLLREGRAAARIRHRNVVTVYGIDSHEGRTGFWMEYLRGDTLEGEVATTGPLAAGDVVRLGLDLAGALSAVHEAGLLHRDLKPANVVRDGEDRYVLTDFGLGSGEGEAAATGPSGTPMYMAPELFAGEPSSERSDQYALGLVLWFALAGRHPFPSETLPDLVAEVRRGPPPLEGLAPPMPRALRDVVERATAPRPADRFGSAAELSAALESCRTELKASDSGRRSLRATLLGGAAVALIAAGLLVAPRLGHRPAAAAYDVDATFLRHDGGGLLRLLDGDRVRPGDRLSLELRVTRPAWVYVLNEDERGRHYLLFPESRYDVQNPVQPDSTYRLPGTIQGRPNAWTVTSAGGREHFLVAVSPKPLPELEKALAGIPDAEPDMPVDAATVGPKAMETLRGVGGVGELPSGDSAAGPEPEAFNRFRALAGRETDVHGVWVRQLVLENPGP